jgi:hypothetical protein
MCFTPGKLLYSANASHIDRKSGKQFVPTLKFQFFVKKTDKKRGDMPISAKKQDPDHGKATSALILIPARCCLL